MSERKPLGFWGVVGAVIVGNVGTVVVVYGLILVAALIFGLAVPTPPTG